MSDQPRRDEQADAGAGNQPDDHGALASVHSGDFLLEQRLGTILRLGVHASTACIAIGLVLNLATPFVATSVWLMTAGLVMLMATPVARVATSVVEYGFGRDWTFFILTSIVLLELCAGIVAALVFHRRL